MIALTQEQRQKRIDWLKQRISSMEECRDEIPFGLSEDETMELAAYKDSLASLTAENFHWPNGCNESIPKALRYLAENDRPSSGNSSFNTEHLYDIAREFELAVSNHFFTAPPVPEIKLPSRIENIHLRTPLEVEDMWIDRFKRLSGLGE